MHRENGVMTLEAAISLIVTISVVLTLSLFARVVYVHGVVQHSLVQTANELATLSYFYSMAGLNTVDKAVSSRVAESNDDIDKTVTQFNEISDAFGAKDFQGVANTVNDITLEDITSFFKALVTSGIGKTYQAGHTELINVITKKFIASYFPSEKEKFYKLGMFVVDGKYDTDGTFPLDLSKSAYFENTAGDEIHIVACYSIRLVTPIPVINRDIVIVQNAKARAWMADWDENYTLEKKAEGNEEEEKSSVWDLPDSQRAEAIATINSALNLDSNFKTIRGFDPKTGKASMFVTINLNEESYEGAPNKAKSTIKRKITSLENYQGYKLMETEVAEDDIKSVDYYVYIPKNASASDKAAAETTAKELSGEIEMYHGNKINLNVIIQEVE